MGKSLSGVDLALGEGVRMGVTVEWIDQVRGVASPDKWEGVDFVSEGNTLYRRGVAI